MSIYSHESNEAMPDAVPEAYERLAPGLSISNDGLALYFQGEPGPDFVTDVKRVLGMWLSAAYDQSDYTSQYRVADDLDSAQSHVNEVLNGKKDIHLSMLLRLAHVLGYSVDIRLVPLEPVEQTPVQTGPGDQPGPL